MLLKLRADIFAPLIIRRARKHTRGVRRAVLPAALHIEGDMLAQRKLINQAWLVREEALEANKARK